MAILSVFSVDDILVIVGLLLGGMLPFLFCSLSIEAVSRAAQAMIEEVRRQFREITGIMDGTGKPEYEKCVAISTHAALIEMVIPGLLAVLSPVVVGVILGKEALGGLLGGAIMTGVMMTLFMANSGGRNLAEGQVSSTSTSLLRSSSTSHGLMNWHRPTPPC